VYIVPPVAPSLISRNRISGITRTIPVSAFIILILIMIVASRYTKKRRVGFLGDPDRPVYPGKITFYSDMADSVNIRTVTRV
jgi:hypothetical protein